MKQNVLHLVLKKQWYDMIEKGIKKEEYRTFNDYWKKRLCECFSEGIDTPRSYYIKPKPYKYVTFHFGYTNKTMTFKIIGFNIGRGLIKWGAKPNHTYFVIGIGERLL